MIAYFGIGFESLDDFALGQVAPAPLGHGQVRIAVEATGLGFVDSLLVRGRYQLVPPLPYIPGGEIVGVIDGIGEGVEGLLLGDRVATWQLGGGLAELAVVDATSLIPVPAGLPATVAAAVLVDYATAAYALEMRAQVTSEDIVLVRGAAGGVGGAAVQLARAVGAYVVAFVSSEEKRAESMRLGANAVTVLDGRPVREQIRASLSGGVASVVFDPVGGDDFEQFFRSLDKEGRHLVLGFASGTIPSLPTNLPLLKSAALVGVDIRHFFGAYPKKASDCCQRIFEKFADGRLQAPQTTVFSLEDSQLAFESLSDRHRIGKIIVSPRC